LPAIGGDPGALIAHYRVEFYGIEKIRVAPATVDFGGRTGADLDRYLAYPLG
jgi:hypothetical protein